MAVSIGPAELADPSVARLFAGHTQHNAESCPSGTDHGLGAGDLDREGVTLLAAHCCGEAVGIGALKSLGARAGEVKSMHTVAAMRGRGVARALLEHIISVAQASGMTRLYLETGTSEDYRAARALYVRFGFQRCPPFADYRDHAASAFYALDLSHEAVRA